MATANSPGTGPHQNPSGSIVTIIIIIAKIFALYPKSLGEEIETNQ